MVVLDEDGIIKRETVIHAAAGAHGVFFQRPEAGRRLAGAGDRGLGAGDSRGDFCGNGGDAGQVAEKIQRRALRRQKPAGRAFDRRDDIAGHHGRSILNVPCHYDRRVHKLEGKLRRIETGDDARFACRHDDD